LRDNSGTEALGIGHEEDVLGLLYLGRPDGALPPAPDRGSSTEFVSFLD
jgi:hypothetical protein